MKQYTRTAPIGTLERGLVILRQLGACPDSSIAQLAEAVGLSRSTAYCIAERLRQLGFLEVAPDSGQWRLGRESVQLGVTALQTTSVMRVGPDLLQAMLREAQESVNLAVFDSDSMVLVFREQGPQSVTISSRLGAHRPMHASAVGKSYLAAMQDSERHVLLGRLNLKRFTLHTLVDAATIERDVAFLVRREECFRMPAVSARW